MKETYKKYYEECKHLVGSATAQQVINVNNESWGSFFGLLRARKECRHPPSIKRVSPPDY